MKKFLIIMSSLIIVNVAKCIAQQDKLDLTPFDWLRGNKIRNFVQIKMKNNVIKWRDGDDVNDVGNYFTLSTIESKPTIFRAKKSAANLKLNFYNPISYAVSIDKEDREDPLYKTTIGFSEKILNVFNTVTVGGLDGFTPPSNNTESTPNNAAGENQRPKKNDVDIMYTNIPSHIANWLLWQEFITYYFEKLAINSGDNERYLAKINILKGKIDKIKFDKNAINNKKLKDELKKIIDTTAIIKSNVQIEKSLFNSSNINDTKTHISEIEEYLHGKFLLDANKPSLTFLEYIKNSIKDLRDAYSFQSLRVAKEKTTALIKSLNNKQTSIKNDLKEIDGFSSLNLDGNDPLYNTFITYSKSEFLSYANDTRIVLKKREELINQLDELNTSVAKYLEEEQTKQVDVTIGKMKVITVTIIQRNINIDDTHFSINNTDRPIVGYCIINESSWAVPEVSGGIAYPTDLSNSNYDLDLVSQTEYKVVDKGRNNVNAVAGLFLNFIFDARIAPGVFPMAQIGIGTGKDAPTLMFGAGVRIYKSISLSVGKIFGFDKVLSTYPVGTNFVVSADSKTNFDNSLQTKLISGGIYVGLQWKFQ